MKRRLSIELCDGGAIWGDYQRAHQSERKLLFTAYTPAMQPDVLMTSEKKTSFHGLSCSRRDASGCEPDYVSAFLVFKTSSTIPVETAGCMI